MAEKKNYPGMFDLIKGYGVISILVVHTFGAVPFDRLYGNVSFVSLDLLFSINSFFLIGIPLIPMFFIISGYGFSGTSMKKCIKKQTNLLLKPYLITALFVTVIFFFSQLAYSGELWRSVIVTSRTALSYLLGISEWTVFWGVDLKPIGTAWFILALFVSWLLLNWITLYVPERFRALCVIACICVGYLCGRDIVIPFCLSQGLIGVGYLYAGQLIKKNDWLFRKLSAPCWCVLILLSLFTSCFGRFAMAYSDYKYGLIDIAGAGCYAFLLVRGALLLNKYNNALTDRLRKIGRYSFWIVCAHTVESQGLFWGSLAKKFGEHTWAAFLTILAMRFALVFLMCQMVNLYSKTRNKRKRIARQHFVK